MKREGKNVVVPAKPGLGTSPGARKAEASGGRGGPHGKKKASELGAKRVKFFLGAGAVI